MRDYWEPALATAGNRRTPGDPHPQRSGGTRDRRVVGGYRRDARLNVVRSRDATAEDDLRIPLRQRRPPQRPARWPYLLILPAVIGVVVLLIRLTTLGSPPPEPEIQPQDQRPTAVAATKPNEPGPAAPAAQPNQAAPAPTLAAPSVRPTLPQFAQIANTGGEGAQMRPQPSLNSRGGAIVLEGTLLEITGSETSAEGITWLPVKDAQGRAGWVSNQYLKVRAAVYAEARNSFWLRAEPKLAAKAVVEVPAGTPLALIDSKGGEVIDQSEAQPSKWYWLRSLTTGEVGWAYTGWVQRRD